MRLGRLHDSRSPQCVCVLCDVRKWPTKKMSFKETTVEAHISTVGSRTNAYICNDVRSTTRFILFLTPVARECSVFFLFVCNSMRKSICKCDDGRWAAVRFPIVSSNDLRHDKMLSFEKNISSMYPACGE